VLQKFFSKQSEFPFRSQTLCFLLPIKNRTFATNISTLCFDYLDAPVCVLGSRNWITPAFELEDSFFPQVSWFLDMINERIQPLAGYVPGQNFTDAEFIRRSKLGV